MKQINYTAMTPIERLYFCRYGVCDAKYILNNVGEIK